MNDKWGFQVRTDLVFNELFHPVEYSEIPLSITRSNITGLKVPVTCDTVRRLLWSIQISLESQSQELSKYCRKRTTTFITVGPLIQSSPGSPTIASRFPSTTILASKLGNSGPTEPAFLCSSSGRRILLEGDNSVSP